MDSTDALARALRRLTLAVWCLCGLIAVLVALWLWSFLGPPILFATRSAQSPSSSALPATGPEDFERELLSDFDDDFYERPLEAKIQRATLIMVVQRQADGDQHKAVISEILKRVPGTRFYYDVGDEYRLLSHIARDQCEDCEGQGEVVFLTGNPARMRVSYSFDDDRIGSLGDMPLAELRRLVEATQPPAP